MEAIDLRDFYSGGYFLLRAGRPDWSPPYLKYVPDGKLISLSRHICPSRLSVLWGWNPGNREAALQFGISEERLAEFVEWCGIEYREVMDLMSMFYSPDAARTFIKRFELDMNNLFIIGAALPKSLQNSWIEEEQNDEGIVKRIKQGVAVEAGGETVGYDIIGYEYTDFSCSWLCSGLDQDMHDLYGIHPNSDGLIDLFDDAKKINDWIAEDREQETATRAEPIPYALWLLSSYPLEIVST